MEPAPWFVLFDVSSEEEIWQACKVLLDLYRTWTGSTDWLLEESAEQTADASVKPVVDRITIWRKAAELDLPLTKSEVRAIVNKV